MGSFCSSRKRSSIYKANQLGQNSLPSLDKLKAETGFNIGVEIIEEKDFISTQHISPNTFKQIQIVGLLNYDISIEDSLEFRSSFYKFKNKRIFRGWWKNGQPIFGSLFLEDQRFYMGFLQNLKMHGFGRLYSNEGISEGRFEEDIILKPFKIGDTTERVEETIPAMKISYSSIGSNSIHSKDLVESLRNSNENSQGLLTQGEKEACTKNAILLVHSNVNLMEESKTQNDEKVILKNSNASLSSIFSKRNDEERTEILQDKTVIQGRYLNGKRNGTFKVILLNGKYTFSREYKNGILVK